MEINELYPYILTNRSNVVRNRTILIVTSILILSGIGVDSQVIDQTMSKPVVTGKFPNTLEWGTTDPIEFTIDQGSTFSFSRDGMIINQGNINSTNFQLTITHWREDMWQLNTYELNLTIFNDFGSTTIISSVEILPYSNSTHATTVIKSSWTVQPENALGKADGKFAEIAYDYENGEIKLETGRRLVQGPGNDLEITAAGGNYTLIIERLQDSSPVIVGRYQGNQTIDLDGSIDMVRSIRIQYLTGKNVLLDAITALHSDISQTGPPELTSLMDLKIHHGDTANITWHANDDYGRNYSIFYNSKLINSSYWYGGDVTFSFTPEVSAVLKIVLENIKGETNSDSIMIEILPSSNNLTNTRSAPFSPLFSFPFAMMGLILIFHKRVRIIKISR